MIDYSDLLGKRFEYGATGPDAYDCYGLVREVYRRNGLELPHYESVCTPEGQHSGFQDGQKYFEPVTGKPQPLDVVLFCIRPPWVSHIGVVIDEYGSFLHIMQQSSVSRERMDSITWKHRVKGIYRFKGVL